MHGTGQGAVEGPINWIPIADIAIALVRRRSKQPVAMPTGDGKMYLFDKAWFVDDSGLGQAGKDATCALQHVTDGSGLVYYLSVTRKTAELENNTGILVRRWPVLGRIDELRCRAYGS